MTSLAMSPFEAYSLFMSVKMHFQTKNYDFFKYKAKLNLKRDSFETRRDRPYFQRLSKRKDLKEYLLSNFLESDVKWIGDLFTDKSEEIYKEWQKRNQSINYMIKTEVSQLDEEFVSYFKVTNGQHPKLLKMYKQRKISIETLTALNELLNFFPIWDKKIEDQIIWPSIRDKCLKYQPFLVYDKLSLKDQLKSIIGRDI